jgi:Zn-dependent protease with chaperone function
MSAPGRPAGPLRTVLAVVVAAPVHLMTLAVAALGILLLWPGTSTFQKILGAGCLVFAYGLRPTLRDGKPDGTVIDLRRSPETAALVREVAGAVHGAAPTRVEVSSALTADLRLMGLRDRVLSISAPLWLALTGQERLALLGHELGHVARGDMWLRRYLDGALHTLREWQGFTAPYRPGMALTPENQILAVSSSGGNVVVQNAATGIIADIVSLLLWPARVLLGGYRGGLERLTAPSRRQEALHADMAAARVAGTDGAVGLLEVLLALPAVETSANRAVSNRSDIAAAIAERMAAFDAGQRRALRHGDAGAAVEGHPATLERLQVVQAEARVEPAVRVSAERWAAVDAELSAAITKQLKRLADDFRYAR